MTNAVNSKVLDIIRKLMKLAADKSNLNESTAAAAKAQALLSKHRLTMAEVEAASATLESGEPIHESASPLYEGERVIHWKLDLAVGLANLNACRVFVRNWRDPKRIRYVVTGRESDIEIVRYFFSSISQQIEQLCKQCMAAGDGSGKTFSNNFKHGATETVLKRLKQADQEVKTEYRGSSALVLVERREAELESWMKSHYNLETVASSPASYNVSARQLGKMAGHRVSLNRGINGAGLIKKLS